MDLPDHLCRHPTGAAIEGLSRRLGVPVDEHDQDWQWTAAQSNRLPEYLSLYESGDLSEDERFTLMEMMIQAAEDWPGELSGAPHWSRIVDLLDGHIELHLCSVWYWALGDEPRTEDCWRVTAAMRALLDRHRERFGLVES